jgi:ATPase subunit of ABC transporter with duplicated ATPase domains
MSKGVEFQNISFAYDSASSFLFTDLTCRFPEGWTGVVGPNGSGKTTLLKLASNTLQPLSGHVQIPGPAVYCEQRTDHVPPSFEELIEDTNSDASKIKGYLGIRADWATRWDTLSHGERKRVQIGLILWRSPPVLAVDEPTNHIDMEARELLLRALKTFKGIGLLVSHDRHLLDTLCMQCLFLNPPLCRMRPGGYTKGCEIEKEEETRRKRQLEKAKQIRKKIEREVVRRKRSAAQADHKRSKKNIGRKDHDAKEKIDRARATGKDGRAGRLFRQLQGRLEQARERQDGIDAMKTHALGIWLPGAISKRNVLFKVEQGTIPVGETELLFIPELVMQPTDRIALTGNNGTGKTTLIKRILGSLKLPEDRLTLIPQEIEEVSASNILDQARSLPKEKLGPLMTVVSQLGSRPERLLESETPSPGETRKLLLALGITHEPHLIIMDEPTNHMDLPSIRCLEEALSECPCGLLLVSHDRHFLKHLTLKRWDIRRVESGRYELRIMDRP